MSKWQGFAGSAPVCVNICPVHVGSHVCGEPAHASALSASLTLYGGTLQLHPAPGHCALFVSAPGTPTKMVLTGVLGSWLAACTSDMRLAGCSQSGHILQSVYPGRVGLDSDVHDAPPSV